MGDAARATRERALPLDVSSARATVSRAPATSSSARIVAASALRRSSATFSGVHRLTFTRYARVGGRQPRWLASNLASALRAQSRGAATIDASSAAISSSATTWSIAVSRVIVASGIEKYSDEASLEASTVPPKRWIAVAPVAASCP